MIRHGLRGSQPSKEKGKELARKLRPGQIASLLITCLLIPLGVCLGSSDPGGVSRAVADIEGLSVIVQPGDGTYEIRTGNGGRSILHARAAAEIDHKWVQSTDYPKHETSQSTFEDALGHGKKVTVTSS